MKSIRIYGLPRSGTNFLEYLIINNINCDYKTKYDTKNSYVNGIISTKQHAIKHCKPNINEGDYFIFILKNVVNFLISFKKWCNINDNEIINLYNKANKDYLEFYNNNKDISIIVFHEQLYMYEQYFLEFIKNKFNLKFKNDKLIISNNRMNKNGGISDSNDVYKGIPFSKKIKHDKINQELILDLQKISWNSTIIL